jgi:FkbM family methyltransferase
MIDSIFRKKLAIDIGANVGLFTEYCLDMEFERVISVEPNPLAVQEFKKMHSDNPAVVLHEIALTGDGQDVNLSVNPGNTLVSSISKSISDNTVTVKSKTLDALMESFEEVDLLKIDIEGAEYDLLANTSEETLKKASNIILEFHDNPDGKVLGILEKLESAGFNYQMYDESIKRLVEIYEDHGVIFAKKIR